MGSLVNLGKEEIFFGVSHIGILEKKWGPLKIFSLKKGLIKALLNLWDPQKFWEKTVLSKMKNGGYTFLGGGGKFLSSKGNFFLEKTHALFFLGGGGLFFIIVVCPPQRGRADHPLFIDCSR